MATASYPSMLVGGIANQSYRQKIEEAYLMKWHQNRGMARRARLGRRRRGR